MPVSAQYVPKRDPTQATELVRLAEGARLFRNGDGEAFASFENNRHTETYPLRSGDFRSYLATRFCEERNQPPSSQALCDALNVLEGQAMQNPKTWPVHVRVASGDGAMWLNLADEKWRVVQVTASEGWRVLTKSPVYFRKPRGMKPLPEPVPGGSVEELRAAFATFANRTSVFGAAIVCADDPGAWSLRDDLRRRVVGYGVSKEAEVRLEITASEARGTEFTVYREDRRLGDVSLPLPGSFNALNALAAITVGLELGLDFDELAAACADFSGVARRFEVRGDRGGVTVIDDYAHHPTELRALLEATRQAMPGRRVVAVFQPHLYSRTRDFASDFASALLGAEVAIVLPIYPAREEPIDGVSSLLVVEEAKRLGHPRVLAGRPIGEAVEQLEELLEPGDVLLTVGAGDVDDLAAAWLEGAA